MKNFNKKIYALNLQSIKYIDSPIPSEYWKLAFNIANSFSKEYAAIGVLNINDLMQEGYLALFKTWKKIDWKYIDSLENLITAENVNWVKTENVAAIIEGSKYPDEYIILTAHLDHVGIEDGEIYNGADDDGSGSMALLEIAQAFKKASEKGKGPKRSIVF